MKLFRMIFVFALMLLVGVVAFAATPESAVDTVEKTLGTPTVMAVGTFLLETLLRLWPSQKAMSILLFVGKIFDMAARFALLLARAVTALSKYFDAIGLQKLKAQPAVEAPKA